MNTWKVFSNAIVGLIIIVQRLGSAERLCEMILQGYLAWWQEDKKGFWIHDNGTQPRRCSQATHRMPSDSGLSYLPLLETVWRVNLVWKYTNVWDISACLFENNIPENLLPLLPERADHQYSITQRSESCFPPCVTLVCIRQVLVPAVFMFCIAIYICIYVLKISISKEKVKSLHVIRSL